jgi:protein disulfide-isomerase
MSRAAILTLCALLAMTPAFCKNSDNPMSSMAPLPEADEIEWVTDFAKAKEMAQKSQKPIFIYFTGSDWCSWCMKMDKEILKTPAFIRQAAPEFIFMKVDFPTYTVLDEATVKQNEELKNQYNIRGFPTIVILDPHGDMVTQLHYENVGGDAYAKNLLKIWDEYKTKKMTPPGK